MSAENGWLAKKKIFQEPPFTYCSIDIFGPILVKEGHKEMKRDACLFKCLSNKVIYIKSTYSISTDAFMKELWRSVSRRGIVQVIGTDKNFVGGQCRTEQSIFRDEPKDSQWVQARAWRSMDPMEKESSYT